MHNPKRPCGGYKEGCRSRPGPIWLRQRHSSRHQPPRNNHTAAHSFNMGGTYTEKLEGTQRELGSYFDKSATVVRSNFQS